MANKYELPQSVPAIDNADRRQAVGNLGRTTLAQQVEVCECIKGYCCYCEEFEGSSLPLPDSRICQKWI
ncbi:glycosyl transferase [Chroococcidiopsis sp. CCALA 051]|uniref:glycosyl transferase n=1 Tax=Chroococcidiopsis sp. CCALA 051 TaxID=869949 RepID=UPI000D0C98E1|nr:glycosyl transferase [Chroococcidiopsis sp. CCALA 051]PSM48177.1 glycosyl transferase [Chroococcidiopsis sp. CCALA 051]